MKKNHNKGKKKYTNGVISKFYFPGSQPEGWWLGCTDAYKQKKSKKQTELWSDADYRAQQMKTRATEEYRDKMVTINKNSWRENYDSRCYALKVAANKRFEDNSQRESCSIRMLQKWSDADYHKSQQAALKEGHIDLYDEHPEYLIKISQGNKDSWEANHDEILQKQFTTKTRNNSWNSSKLEEMFYQELLIHYDAFDVIRQYRDERYPFYCDFYIISEDRFIEIQGTWTHGGHPFDENNPEDIKTLTKWQEKAKTSDYFKAAIKVWTVIDPLKMKIAKENDLNIEFIY